MVDERPPIPPNRPRWQPNPDPSSIHVPGLDTTAPVHDQIEQIEQLITIKLQNIDGNFSKIHHVLATKLLPAVKRYAVSAEPVREAAKFWTSFYEQAAQISIPTLYDYSTVNDVSERAEAPELLDPSHAQTISPQSRVMESSMAATESSFAPGHAAFSSTPAMARVTKTEDSFVTQNSDNSSWMTSVESPLVRLDREFQKLSREREDEDNNPKLLTSGQIPSLRYDGSTPDLRQQGRPVQSLSIRRNNKDTDPSLLRNVLDRNLHSEEDISRPGFSNLSPLKFHGKRATPIPKKYNPYLPPDTDPLNWNGVVDLRDQSISTPRRRKGRPSPQTPGIDPRESEGDDDSFDGLPPGMSPPVMMSPARPPRSSAELGLLGQTPKTEIMARITRDLVKSMQYKSGVESSMSTMPTPPSLSRYGHLGMDTSDSIAIDSSLESMMQRVGLLNAPSTLGTGSTPGLRLRQRMSQQKPTSPSYPAPFLQPIATTREGLLSPSHTQGNIDLDSDSDSLDEINTTAHPSAAFLMASAQGNRNSDDSFGSSNHSSDSFAEEDVNLDLAPVHPFARGVEENGMDNDDSYDDDMYDGGDVQEETLFGVPPAERILAQGQPARISNLM